MRAKSDWQEFLEDLPKILFFVIIGGSAMSLMLFIAFIPLIFVLGVGTGVIGLLLQEGFKAFGVQVDYWVPYFIGFFCSFMYIVLQD